MVLKCGHTRDSYWKARFGFMKDVFPSIEEESLITRHQIYNTFWQKIFESIMRIHAHSAAQEGTWWMNEENSFPSSIHGGGKEKSLFNKSILVCFFHESVWSQSLLSPCSLLCLFNSHFLINFTSFVVVPFTWFTIACFCKQGLSDVMMTWHYNAVILLFTSQVNVI